MPRSAVLALLAVLLPVPAAHAATAYVADGRVHFEAAPGERNVVRQAYVSGGDLELSDRAGGLVAGEGCRSVLPRRVVCDGHGLVALCGDGRDRIENPDKYTFVDVSCERVRFYTDGTSVRNSLTVLSHPVAVTARAAVFRIRCAQSSDNDFGEYNDCSGAMSLSADPGRLGVRGFASRAPGATFRVSVPLAQAPEDAVVAGIDFAEHDPFGRRLGARWSLLLSS